MFCDNDFADNVDRNKYHAEAGQRGSQSRQCLPGQLTAPALDWIKNHSYLGNYVWYRADLIHKTRLSRKQEDETPWAAPSPSRTNGLSCPSISWRSSRLTVRLRKRSSWWSISPATRSFPKPSPTAPTSWRTRRLKQRLCLPSPGRSQIETIDLLPAFLARKNKTGERLTFQNDGHWNPTGHQAVAELLSDYLLTHAAE